MFDDYSFRVSADGEVIVDTIEEAERLVSALCSLGFRLSDVEVKLEISCAEVDE